MADFVVITGTDTAVGKTVLAAGLAETLVARGRRVVAVKPIETGCSRTPDAREDGVILAQATGQPAPRAALRRFTEPLTPALAAERQNVRLDLGELLKEIQRAAESAELALIEGAGGLLSPLGWDWTLLDLASRLDARVIVVAMDRLGCLNHLLLTLRALNAKGVRILGVVLVAPEASDSSTGTNLESIRRVLGRSPGGPLIRFATIGRVDPDEGSAGPRAGKFWDPGMEVVAEWL